MSYVPLSLRYPTGELLCPPVTPADLGRRAAGAASGAVVDDAARMKPYLALPPSFGPELTPVRPIDITKPDEAGWTFVVSELDERRAERTAIVRRLAEHRGMADPGSPLVFDGDSWHARATWVDEHYLGAPTRPKYVLLLGGPDVLPFELQAELGAAGASVGRLSFAGDAGLEAYVDKVLGFERAADPVPSPRAVVFAVDHGRRDPTWYSRKYMAAPIADRIEAKPPFAVTRLFGEEATKQALVAALADERAAFVYTASHGMFADAAQGLDVQQRLNGAICCHAPGMPLEDGLLTASDVPPDDQPCVEGGVVVQFACWGYGTPTESCFDHWHLGTTGINAERPFVSALPTRLLAHPRGPVSYIGHVDLAWLHGFTDPDSPEPDLGQSYDQRLEPFLTAVDAALLRLWPAGLGLDDLSNRTASLSVALASFFDTMKKRGKQVDALSDAELSLLADGFVRRNDAMNFLLLGDPAARARVGAG